MRRFFLTRIGLVPCVLIIWAAWMIIVAWFDPHTSGYFMEKKPFTFAGVGAGVSIAFLVWLMIGGTGSEKL